MSSDQDLGTDFGEQIHKLSDGQRLSRARRSFNKLGLVLERRGRFKSLDLLLVVFTFNLSQGLLIALYVPFVLLRSFVKINCLDIVAYRIVYIGEPK